MYFLVLINYKSLRHIEPITDYWLLITDYWLLITDYIARITQKTLGYGNKF